MDVALRVTIVNALGRNLTVRTVMGFYHTIRDFGYIGTVPQILLPERTGTIELAGMIV
jgi:hypothetical protein